MAPRLGGCFLNVFLLFPLLPRGTPDSLSPHAGGESLQPDYVPGPWAKPTCLLRRRPSAVELRTLCMDGKSHIFKVLSCTLQARWAGQVLQAGGLVPTRCEHASSVVSVCVCAPPCTQGSHSIQISLKQGCVTLLSNHMPKICGQEWGGKLGRFPVPACSVPG